MPAPTSNPFDFDRKAPPRCRAKAVFLPAWAIVTLVLLGVLACLVWFIVALVVLTGDSSSHVETRGIQPKDDPYPEDCPVVRAWLKDRYGEVVILRWGHGNLTGIRGIGEYRTFRVRFQKPGYAEQS